tara:strand:- start:13188 stop:13751 length:564 start_codon:yes stop_codon:yes gene_type:complete
MSHQVPRGFGKGGMCQYITKPRVHLQMIRLLIDNRNFFQSIIVDNKQTVEKELKVWKHINAHPFSVEFINKEKQFGLVATEKILKGSNIGPYLGEYIPEKEARKRNTSYGVKLELPQKAGYPKWPLFIIDAENYGTGMRYMNHDKANPNVELEVESIMLNELWFPIIIARTIRDIKQGEELCLNYWT